MGYGQTNPAYDSGRFDLETLAPYYYYGDSERVRERVSDRAREKVSDKAHASTSSSLDHHSTSTSTLRTSTKVVERTGPEERTEERKKNSRRTGRVDKEPARERKRDATDALVDIVAHNADMNDVFRMNIESRPRFTNRMEACLIAIEALKKHSVTAGRRNLTASGFNVDEAQECCSTGRLKPRDLVHYCLAVSLESVHTKGAICFRTRRFCDDDDEDVHDQDANGAKNARTGVHVDHETFSVKFDADIDHVASHYHEIGNVSKPIRSVHSYKIDDLRAMCEKVRGIADDGPKPSTKIAIYEAIAPHFLPF